MCLQKHGFPLYGCCRSVGKIPRPKATTQFRQKIGQGPKTYIRFELECRRILCRKETCLEQRSTAAAPDIKLEIFIATVRKMFTIFIDGVVYLWTSNTS